MYIHNILNFMREYLTNFCAIKVKTIGHGCKIIYNIEMDTIVSPEGQKTYCNL